MTDSISGSCSNKPNIIVLMADTVMTRGLGCYGFPQMQTDTINALSQTSTLFENLYQPGNMCKPSRTTWLTGMLPHSHQVYTNEVNYDRKQKTLLKTLSQEGYRGGYLGLFHLWEGLDRDGMDDWSWVDWDWDYITDHNPDATGPGSREGFNNHIRDMGMRVTWEHLVDQHHFAGHTNFPIEEHNTVRITDKALECIDDFRPEGSQFLWVSYWMPHEPWSPPVEYLDAFQPEAMELPGNVHGKHVNRLPHHDDNFCVRAMNKIASDDDRWLKRVWAGYAGTLKFVDDQIKRIIDHLKQKQLFDDALVVFTTDHGTTHGSHGFMFKGASYMVDELNRIPFMIKLPGQKEAHRVPSVVSSADLYPTLMDLLGIDGGSVDGQSLVDCLTKGKRDDARAFCQHESGLDDQAQAVRMIRRGPWKYSLYSKTQTFELFNMDEDPLELHNLSDQGVPEMKDLHDELVGQINDSRDIFIVR